MLFRRICKYTVFSHLILFYLVPPLTLITFHFSLLYYSIPPPSSLSSLYRMEVPLGAGSGFIWDDKGHIVTNYHVVRNAKKAQVAVLTRVFRDIEQDDAVEEDEGAASEPSSLNKILFGGGKGRRREGNTGGDDDNVTDYARSVYKAKVVGFDPDKDIAVLKIDAPVYDLNPLELGSSKGLKVGQEALAIGTFHQFCSQT
jgi:S1-C subfamily serine protease